MEDKIAIRKIKEACGRGDYELFESLYIKTDINPNRLITDACRGGNLKIVKVLAEELYEADETDYFHYLNNGMLPAISNNHYPVVYYLLESGAIKWFITDHCMIQILNTCEVDYQVIGKEWTNYHQSKLLEELDNVGIYKDLQGIVKQFL